MEGVRTPNSLSNIFIRHRSGHWAETARESAKRWRHLSADAEADVALSNLMKKAAEELDRVAQYIDERKEERNKNLPQVRPATDGPRLPLLELFRKHGAESHPTRQDVWVFESTAHCSSFMQEASEHGYELWSSGCMAGLR
jgi:hypothetical protein